jgi:hypothetical protein
MTFDPNATPLSDANARASQVGVGTSVDDVKSASRLAANDSIRVLKNGSVSHDHITGPSRFSVKR